MQDLQKSSQKIRQQISITTDTSSITSSMTDSDIDDGITTYENSSIDEESNYSEESHAWSSLKFKNKIKKKSRNEIIWRYLMLYGFKIILHYFKLIESFVFTDMK